MAEISLSRLPAAAAGAPIRKVRRIREIADQHPIKAGPLMPIPHFSSPGTTNKKEL
jgi:hypothetical protein